MRSYHLLHASWFITLLSTWAGCTSDTAAPGAKPWTSPQLGSATGGTQATVTTPLAGASGHAALAGAPAVNAGAIAGNAGPATSTPATGASGSTAVGGAALPCSVSQILSANCSSCHAATPLNGAPMPLVTYADLTAPAHSNPAQKVYQLVAARIEDRARPMPPDPTKRLKDGEIAEVKNWAAAGAQPGAACTAGAAGSGGSGVTAAGAGAVVDMPGTATASDADIEKCYELRAHGQPVAGDTSSYTVPAGENYSGFIFKAPWTQPVQGLRFRHLADNAAVLHHWLLYSESGDVEPDSIEACDLGGPTGFLCGQATTRALITGWAPGRGDFRLPEGVGLELPAPGALLAVEFHYYNSSGAAAQDRSGVEVCVTSKFRPNTATVTWLGTETIEIPAQAAGTAAGTCMPARRGMNATDPIHVLFSWPHMHKLGTHMKSIVNRKAGGQETLYDGDFSFEFQVLYDTPLLLNPGDTVTTTCSYQNTTPNQVSFGQSTTQEMCFNFTYAWPAHALDNPGGAIGAASNTCFQ